VFYILARPLVLYTWLSWYKASMDQLAVCFSVLLINLGYNQHILLEMNANCS